MSSIEKPASEAIGGTAQYLPQPIYFPVSLTKLFVLSFCTFGLYEIYWFYKNWQLVKERERSDIMPFWRALFTIIFCYPLFRRIGESVKQTVVDDLPVGPLAVGWVIVTLLWKLPDPYWLISFMAILFLLPVQRAINKVNVQQAPTHDANRSFSAWNIAAVLVGGLLFALAIIGTFLPSE